jgi:hypothetical protein
MTTKEELLLPAAVLTAALVLHNKKSELSPFTPMSMTPKEISSKFWDVYGKMYEQKPEDEGHIHHGVG